MMSSVYCSEIPYNICFHVLQNSLLDYLLLQSMYFLYQRSGHLLQKISWCPKSSHKQYLFQQHDFSFNIYKSVANTNSKEQGLLMDQDRGKP